MKIFISLYKSIERFVYCNALLIAILYTALDAAPFFSHYTNTSGILAQIPSLTDFPTTISIFLLIFYLYRFFMIAAGKVNLSQIGKSKFTTILRFLGTFYMSLSLTGWIVFIAAAVQGEAVAYIPLALVVETDGFVYHPLSLVLFEASRLIDFELSREVTRKSSF